MGGRFGRPRTQAQISVPATGRQDKFCRQNPGGGTDLQGKGSQDIELGAY